MLTLAKRTAKIGNAINTRAEMHGEDSVTALDIPLTDIMLDARELNAIMREPHAHNVLFDQSGVAMGGRIVQPVFQHIKPLQLAEKIEGASIVITHGIDNQELRLVNINLAKVRLEPCVGGLTAMSCTVQCTPDLDAGIASLLERLNSTVEVEIDCGEFGKQQDLPLNKAREGEEPERGAEKPKGRGKGKRAGLSVDVH